MDDDRYFPIGNGEEVIVHRRWDKPNNEGQGSARFREGTLLANPKDVEKYLRGPDLRGLQRYVQNRLHTAAKFKAYGQGGVLDGSIEVKGRAGNHVLLKFVYRHKLPGEGFGEGGRP